MDKKKSFNVFYIKHPNKTLLKKSEKKNLALK
jgi:hypothetical protein